VGQIHSAVMGGSKDLAQKKKEKEKREGGRKKGLDLTDFPKEEIAQTNLVVLILFSVIFSFQFCFRLTLNTRVHGNTKAPETMAFPIHSWGFLPFPTLAVDGGFHSYLLPPLLREESMVGEFFNRDISDPAKWPTSNCLRLVSNPFIPQYSGEYRVSLSFYDLISWIFRKYPLLNEV